jgi:hypothetical protein
VPAQTPVRRAGFSTGVLEIMCPDHGRRRDRAPGLPLVRWEPSSTAWRWIDSSVMNASGLSGVDGRGVVPRRSPWPALHRCPRNPARGEGWLTRRPGGRVPWRGSSSSEVGRSCASTESARHLSSLPHTICPPGNRPAGTAGPSGAAPQLPALRLPEAKSPQEVVPPPSGGPQQPHPHRDVKWDDVAVPAEPARWGRSGVPHRPIRREAAGSNRNDTTTRPIPRHPHEDGPRLSRPCCPR